MATHSKLIIAAAFVLSFATNAVHAQAPTPTAAPVAVAASKPRVLVIDKKDVKVWGVPTSRHFTKNNLFPNFWGKCPTGLVRADEVHDKAILAKYKAPNVDYLYHFVCLQEEPTS